MKRIGFVFTALMVVASLSAGNAAADRDGLNAPGVRYLDDYSLAGPVNYYTDVEAVDKEGHINVIVEIPRGTTAKWEVSRETGNILWEMKNGKPRTVDFLGGYPVNYGTVPKTLFSAELGGEGESLDVILFGERQKRGAVVQARLIGVLMIQEGDGTYDDKLLAVAKGSPEYGVKDLDELNARFGNIGEQTASWFTNYKGPESGLRVRGLGSADQATKLFYASLKIFNGEK